MSIEVMLSKDTSLVISFGRDTPWFQSVWWFTVEKRYFEKRDVVFAELLITWFPKEGFGGIL